MREDRYGQRYGTGRCAAAPLFAFAADIPQSSLLLVANTINAGTDIGAIAAAINLLVPIPIVYLIVPIALVIVAVQFWGSYRLISGVFKWLTLALFAYIRRRLLAKPNWQEVIESTFVPRLSFRQNLPDNDRCDPWNNNFTLPVLWQASQEVEEGELGTAAKLLSSVRARPTPELRNAVAGHRCGNVHLLTWCIFSRHCGGSGDDCIHTERQTSSQPTDAA